MEIVTETASIASTGGLFFPWGIFNADGKCLSTHETFGAAERHFRRMNYIAATR